MLIQINTDRNIESSAALIAHFSELIKETLTRYDEHITRVEAHLSDENGSKDNGADKKCVLETKIKGGSPIVVTTVESTPHIAVKSAAEKVAALLEKSLEKKRVQS
ncbi:MAG: HPF/RaiA family ribosome-associated protein [Ferruginibacter sp.]